MKFILVSLLVLLVLSSSIKIQKNSQEGCPGEQNTKNLLTVEPQLVSQTANGSRYTIPYGSEEIPIMVVTGSAEEMGFAVGKLMKLEIEANINNFEQYIETNINEILESIQVPSFLAKIFGSYTVQIIEGMLDIEATVTAPYTSGRFSDEIKGMANGSGLPQKAIRNINLFQELFQSIGGASIAASWSSASQNQGFYTLRTLDWPANSPVNKHPLITVYKPTEDGSYPFANIGYASIIGAISPISSQGVSIQEKVWIPQQGQESGWSYLGTPFQYVLRDLAQFGNNIESLYNRLEEANRTVRIYVGMASASSNTFEGVEYSKKVLQAYTDSNYTSIYSDAHPQLDGVFFWDQYTQPSSNPCFGNVLKNNLGSINAQTFYGELAPTAQTGKSQVVVADVQTQTVYVAYAGDGLKAYENQFVQIDLHKFF